MDEGRSRIAARRPSGDKRGRGQPAEEPPRQPAAVVEHDACGIDLAIWKHSSLIAQSGCGRQRYVVPANAGTRHPWRIWELKVSVSMPQSGDTAYGGRDDAVKG